MPNISISMIHLYFRGVLSVSLWIIVNSLLALAALALEESLPNAWRTCSESMRIETGPGSRRSFILVNPAPKIGVLTMKSKNIVSTLPSEHQYAGVVRDVRQNPWRYSPASQLAFVRRYSRSMLLTHMDRENVALPIIVKKNIARAKPSHRVVKFLTIQMSWSVTHTPYTPW